MPKPRAVAPPPDPSWRARLAHRSVALVWVLFWWAAPILLPMILAALALLGLEHLGQAARADLSTRDHAMLAFAKVDCPSPPGLDREEFLGEVQYLAAMPDRLGVLDEDLASRLADAFARHPWVEQVEGVTVRPDRRVQVRLRFRRPVMAVRSGGQLRALAAGGVLLPATAGTNGLPMYPGNAPPPRGPAGTPWGDEGVESASRAAQSGL